MADVDKCSLDEAEPRRLGRSDKVLDPMINDEPQSFSTLACLLDAQPEPVRTMFQYCLALAMVELGRGQLAETVAGDAGPICIFETNTGERFSLARPPMSENQEARVIEELKRILGEAHV